MQPLGPHGGFMVAPLFNKEANISPPWVPIGPTNGPRKINIWFRPSLAEFVFALGAFP